MERLVDPSKLAEQVYDTLDEASRSMRLLVEAFADRRVALGAEDVASLSDRLSQIQDLAAELQVSAADCVARMEAPDAPISP